MSLLARPVTAQSGGTWSVPPDPGKLQEFLISWFHVFRLIPFPILRTGRKTLWLKKKGGGGGSLEFLLLSSRMWLLMAILQTLPKLKAFLRPLLFLFLDPEAAPSLPSPLSSRSFPLAVSDPEACLLSPFCISQSRGADEPRSFVVSEYRRTRSSFC